MNVQHIGIVSQSSQVSLSDVNLVAAAVQRQITEEFREIWGIDATISAFSSTASMPVGYWPIMIMDELPDPSAEGYHEDQNGQPYAVVTADSGWPLTTSHEILEMLVDPFGQRLTTGPSPAPSVYDGTVQYLVEVCDPCEGAAFAYQKNGIQVSDFYTPNYFDAQKNPGVRYSANGSIENPREVLAEGYFTWFTPDGRTFQTLVDASGAATVRQLNLQLKPGSNIRSAVDAHTKHLRKGTTYDSSKLVGSAHAKAMLDRARVWDLHTRGLPISTGQAIQNLARAAHGLGMRADAENPDFCSIYKELKDVVDKALPFIKDLPDGAAIVQGIQLLETLLDKFCAPSLSQATLGR